MPSTTLLVVSALAALVGVAVYLPMQRSTTLFEGPAVVENFGMDRCKRVSGPAFCDDVRVQRNLNLGFLACDPSLPYRNFAASVFDEAKMKEDGALWVYDLNKSGSPAEKLTIKGFEGPFHPSGISFAPTSDDGTPARVVILVVNHVPLEMPRVEVLYYYPARKSLVYKKTISSEHFFAANKIAASSSPMVHQHDDTPSFFVTNDHGYNLTDWKRTYEEKYNLPAASLVYYNARADLAQEVGWRFQLPSAIVASHEDDSLWVAQAKGGTVDLYKSHVLSVEHQEQRVRSADTREPISIIWPGMMNEEIMNTKIFNVGLDYEPESMTLVTISHPKWNNYVAVAKEKLHSRDAEPTTKAGFILSKANLYPVRVGETRPKPRKDVVFDPEETPRRYKYKLFLEPLISNDGSDFGTPSAIAVSGGRALVSSGYEQGFLDCSIAP
ncbi:Serum paraoxonase/arylesterase 1 [Dissophora globulifera]|nr:Serum paraoxonase/arylesterase 1 [Dissophora globulifera]